MPNYNSRHSNRINSSRKSSQIVITTFHFPALHALNCKFSVDKITYIAI